jgi:omega-6 fatty acid desaturase (delta-12 desaturase)
LAAPWWPLQVAAAIANGVFSATLFVVGHDACHGSLTTSAWLNQVLGRLAFLPSLTPYVTWEYAHNRVHHSYTNLWPKDYAWAPLSKEAYDRLPWWRRALERHYRTPFGLGSYYLVEYWWKHLFLPARAERQEMKRPVTFALDWLLAAAFFIGQSAAIVAWSGTLTPTQDSWGPFTAPAALWIVAWLVPFLIWNWLMGFAIYQHHNHQSIAWYNDRSEWDFFAAQVESTVHVQMPGFLEWASARIMQHTAHHVNPKIPLYRLAESQRCLERAYPQIVIQIWRLGTLSRTMALCKLYDYQNHRWLDFAGVPTTRPNCIIKALRETECKLETSSKGLGIGDGTVN